MIENLQKTNNDKIDEIPGHCSASEVKIPHVVVTKRRKDTMLYNLVKAIRQPRPTGSLLEGTGN